MRWCPERLCCLTMHGVKNKVDCSPGDVAYKLQVLGMIFYGRCRNPRTHGVVSTLRELLMTLLNLRNQQPRQNLCTVERVRKLLEDEFRTLREKRDLLLPGYCDGVHLKFILHETAAYDERVATMVENAGAMCCFVEDLGLWRSRVITASEVKPPELVLQDARRQ